MFPVKLNFSSFVKTATRARARVKVSADESQTVLFARGPDWQSGKSAAVAALANRICDTSLCEETMFAKVPKYMTKKRKVPGRFIVILLVTFS